MTATLHYFAAYEADARSLASALEIACEPVELRRVFGHIVGLHICFKLNPMLRRPKKAVCLGKKICIASIKKSLLSKQRKYRQGPPLADMSELATVN